MEFHSLFSLIFHPFSRLNAFGIGVFSSAHFGSIVRPFQPCFGWVSARDHYFRPLGQLSTVGVTGFVGSGTKPTPLTDEEVQQLGVEKHEIVVAYSEGDTVKIADGPLTS